MNLSSRAAASLITPASVDAQRWQQNGSGLFIPRRQRKRYDQPVGISLFTGAGGFDCGMVNAGFHVVAAVEYDCAAVATYMVNLTRWGQVQMHWIEPSDFTRFEKFLKSPAGLGKILDSDGCVSTSIYSLKDGVDKVAWVAGSGYIAGHPEIRGTEHVFVGDIRKLTGKRLMEAIGMERGDVDCIFGGPPCQGFSTAGRQNVMDPRNSLVFEFTRLVRELSPKTFVLENVPGLSSMVTPEGINVVDAICLDLEGGGYGNYHALRDALLNNPAARAASKKLRQNGPSAEARETRKAKKQSRPKPQPIKKVMPVQTGLFGDEEVA